MARRSTLDSRRALGAFWLVAALMAGSAPAAQAQTAASPGLQAQMTGHFVLAEPPAAVQARLDATVEQVVAPMNFLIRPIARSRLGRVVVFCAEYQLALSATEVSVTCDARPPVRRKLYNSEGKVAGLDAEPVDVKVEVGQDNVALHFKADDGQRTTTYRFDGKDGMEITVRVTSTQIEKPIEWKIRYRRSSATGERRG